MRPKAVIYLFSHHIQYWFIDSMLPSVAVTHIDHWGSVLSHRKGGTCNNLVKVKVKQLSVRDAFDSFSAMLKFFMLMAEN